MTFKYAVEIESGHRFVVRFYPSGRESVSDFEPQLLLRASAAGMRVPQVLAHSADGPESPLCYVLYSMIPGRPLDELLNKLSAHRLKYITDAICENLDMLSSLTVSGYGALKTGEVAEFSSFRSLFEGAINSFRSSGGHFVLPDLDRAADVILGNSDLLRAAGAPAICWADISPENVILTDGGALAGLIDFEGAIAAEATLNLGYVVARFAGSPFLPPFRDSFTQKFKTEDARIAAYAALRALRIWPHHLRPLPTGIARMPLRVFLPGLDWAISTLVADPIASRRNVPE